LLQAAERAVERHGNTFEIKQCFSGVTFNSKPKWEIPTEKKGNGLFSLGDEPTGLLKFQFTLNPVQLKETEKMIKKAKEEGD